MKFRYLARRRRNLEIESVWIWTGIRPRNVECQRLLRVNGIRRRVALFSSLVVVVAEEKIYIGRCITGIDLRYQSVFKSEEIEAIRWRIHSGRTVIGSMWNLSVITFFQIYVATYIHVLTYVYLDRSNPFQANVSMKSYYFTLNRINVVDKMKNWILIYRTCKFGKHKQSNITRKDNFSLIILHSIALYSILRFYQ